MATNDRRRPARALPPADVVQPVLLGAEGRIASLLTWARANGYSVGALTVGDVSIALTDMQGGGKGRPAEGPKDAAEGEADEDIYEQYGRGDPEWDALQARKKG